MLRSRSKETNAIVVVTRNTPSIAVLRKKKVYLFFLDYLMCIKNKHIFFLKKSFLRFFFLGFLEVDNGGRGSDATATANTLGPVLLPVTRPAIQLHVVGGHVLQLQHFIAQIAFEASSVVFVVADHDLLGSINGGVAFWAFSRLHRFERHFKSCFC